MMMKMQLSKPSVSLGSVALLVVFLVMYAHPVVGRTEVSRHDASSSALDTTSSTPPLHSLPFTLCGNGTWPVYSLSIDPYPIVKGTQVNVMIPTDSDHAVVNATDPPGYTLHIKILYEDFLEVYNSKKPFCDLVNDCPLGSGNVTLTYKTGVPAYSLSGSYTMTLNAYRDNELLFCGYSDLKIVAQKGNEIEEEEDLSSLSEERKQQLMWSIIGTDDMDAQSVSKK